MNPENSFSYSREHPLQAEDRQLLIDDVTAKLEASRGEKWWYESLESYTKQILTTGTAEQASVAAEIVLADTLHGNPIPDMLGKGGAHDEYEKLRQLIGISVNEPELAHAIVANTIGGFHGSNSSSLLGVLEHGILSSRDARDRGLALGSGERTYTRPSEPSFISFADWRAPDTLRQYANRGRAIPLTIRDLRHQVEQLQVIVDNASRDWGNTHPFAINGRLTIEDTEKVIAELEANPNSLEAQLVTANFPVLYGLDISAYVRTRSSTLLSKSSSGTVLAERVASDIEGEFALFNGPALPEQIPVIAVPRERVGMVRQLVRHARHGIDVYPIDALITRY